MLNKQFETEIFIGFKGPVYILSESPGKQIKRFQKMTFGIDLKSSGFIKPNGDLNIMVMMLHCRSDQKLRGL